MILQLLNQLRSDQQTDDMEHSQTMARYTTEIETLEQNLEHLGTELTNTNQFLVAVTRELSALAETIKSLEKQLDLLNGKEEEIRAAREADEIAYNRRKYNSQRVLNALNLVLEKLTAAVFREQNSQGAVLLETERDEMVTQIRKELGHSHPIAVLVAMTAKFDVPTVQRIIEKLENIREGVIASMTDDDAHEVEAVASFNAVIKEINEVREKLSNDYNTAKQSFNRKTNEKIIAERTRDQLEIEIPLTQRILEETRNQKELYHADYTSRTMKRGKEIEIVQAAYNLVNDNVQAVRK
jgi:hypothetical protein